MVIPHKQYLLILSVFFLTVWIVFAIDPLSRHDWALENVLIVVSIIMLIASYKYFVLSRISYTLIFIFLCLHEIGAHYTYAEVPYDSWFRAFTGQDFNELVGWERNNFDRVIQFCYGLLLAYPLREVFIRIVDVRGFWGYFLPMDLTMSTSMLYELIEWGAATLFGGELGMAYLGTQGDIWDSHKDMALASLGALTAMTFTALLNFYLQRDFAHEWAESLNVKHVEPLGEDEITRLLQKRSASNQSKPESNSSG